MLKEKLESVIRKIILPQFPEVSLFEVQVVDAEMSPGNTLRQYNVVYVLKEQMSDSREEELETETKSMFNMLGRNPNEWIMVIPYVPE